MTFLNSLLSYTALVILFAAAAFAAAMIGIWLRKRKDAKDTLD